MEKENNLVDVLIVGSGPAGLTASVYASRYRLSNVVVGKLLGGMITLAHQVENFPGFTSISGLELAQKIAAQAKALGGRIITAEAVKIQKEKECFQVVLKNKQVLKGKTLIVATGTERRKLNIPGEKEYLGKGVSYCTTCDIPFFRGKRVALIGGSNAAVSGAIHAANFAQKVYLIYRRDKLRADPIWTEQALKNPRIEVIYNTNLTQIEGDEHRVTGVELDRPYCQARHLSLEGVFIEIGGVPATNLLEPLGVALTENNFVKVTAAMETNIPGLFAAGDLTSASQIMQQAVTACAQGAIAATSAFRHLKS